MPTGCSGTPLAKKLGIKADHTVATINEPADFRQLLVDLPADTTFQSDLSGEPDLSIVFFTSKAELEDQLGICSTQSTGVAAAGASCRGPDECNLFRSVQRGGDSERCSLDCGLPSGAFAAPIFGHQCVQALREREDGADVREPGGR